MDRDRKRKREGGVCSNGLPKSVGRTRWTWMARIENSVDDGEDKNGEMCMGVCVCVYAPVNEKGIKGKMMFEKFWEELGQLLKKFENVRELEAQRLGEW